MPIMTQCGCHSHDSRETAIRDAARPHIVHRSISTLCPGWVLYVLRFRAIAAVPSGRTGRTTRSPVNADRLHTQEGEPSRYTKCGFTLRRRSGVISTCARFPSARGPEHPRDAPPESRRRWSDPCTFQSRRGIAPGTHTGSTDRGPDGSSRSPISWARRYPQTRVPCECRQWVPRPV
jgi:hypothetical protein